MIETLSTSDDLEKFPENEVAFISFNYDRSLEHFLYTSLWTRFISRNKEIRANVKEFLPFPFIHIYGQVDKPEWDGGSPYRDPFEIATIDKLKKNIRVIGERTNDYVNELMKLYEWAEKIYLLGFGYADENLDAIGIRKFIIGGTRGTRIYGTARGKTPDEINRIKRRLVKGGSTIPFSLLEKNIKLEPIDCYKLLRDFPLA
jgi:hypothetical protein